MTTLLPARLVLLGIILLVAFAPLRADDVLWVAPGNGDFHDPAAWASGSVPTTSDRAVFPASFSAYTVGFSAEAETAGLLVSNFSTAFDLSGSAYFVNGAAQVDSGATLDVSNGLMLSSSDFHVGGGAGQSNLSFLAGSQFAGPAVYVGQFGSGRLLVGTGASFETGLLQAGHVLGREGRIIIEGGAAAAARTFLGGSEVCIPFCNVGVGPGILFVQGGGVMDAGALSMGKNGNAEVVVRTGGQLNATSITMSQGGNASLIVREGGSVQALSLGIEAATASPSAGTGSVSVLTGSRLQVDSLAVGPAAYSSSSTISADRRLLVSGSGAEVLVNGALHVKGGGSRMEISESGTVQSLSALIAGSNDVAAEVTVASGGLWRNTGAMEVGKFLESGSRLTIDGGRIDTGSFYFASSTACVPFCNVVPRSDLVIRNGGILQTGTFHGGRIGEAGIRVESGGSITSSEVALGSGFRPLEVSITGPGSEWINAGDANLGISGAQPTGTVSLRIENGGVFATGGTLNTASLATVTVAGGTLDVGAFGTLAGVLDFQVGHVITRGDLAIRAGAPLGGNLLLQSNRALTVGGTTTIDGNQSLTIEGGRFATGSLQRIGQFSFTSGVLALTSDPFVVGSGGLLGSAVALTDSRRLEVTNQLTVAPSAILNVSGDALSAGALRNEGTLQLGGGISRITTSTLDNAGRLLGAGTIQGSLDNAAGGQVRLTSGQELDVAGRMRNSGEVFVLGGTLQVGDRLENERDGFVSGRGVLATGGMTNLGTMAFSGTTDVIGDVMNEKEGAIAISGGATLTFYDDVVHNGHEIRASPGSNAVFFGSVAGAGAYTGGGNFFFEGDLRPGNSPAITSVTGNATLGPKSLEIQIAGLTPGTEHDAVHVSGDLTLLGGTLNVFFLYGYMAGAGDSFDLLDFANLFGQFSGLNLPMLANGLAWNSTQLYSDGVLSVEAVPEPATIALLAAGLVLLGGFSARRRLRA